ncbi:MAG: hypothetical protein AAF495_21795 [Pseudomonadota bacterium]
MPWHDLVGNAGVALIIGSYFLLQAGWFAAKDLAYSLGNLIGASLVMISLVQEFNMAAFVLEAFWFLISGYGIFVWLRGRRA